VALTIARALLQAVIDQARRERPYECCGLLAGRSHEVLRVVPMVNSDRSPTTFRADPLELLAAFEELDRAGLELVGIYHSHPATPARMSPTDLRYAPGYPDVAHVIVSLAGDEGAPAAGASSAPVEVRAFRLVDGHVVAEEVLVR